MKRSLLLMALMAIVLIMAGCIREKEYARPAVYGRVYSIPANPKVGDTVTLAVEVQDAGNRIYHADYTWKIPGELNKGAGSYSEVVHVTAPDNSKTITAQPTLKYVFKYSGGKNITLSARFKYSMADENGAMQGTASASGSVNPRL